MLPRKHLRTALTLSFLALASIAHALVAPVKDIRLLVDPIETETISVPGASVVVADYPLLRRDFPELKNYSPAQIDDWLLEKTAYIATSQRTLGGRHGVNRSIKTGRTKATAYRPKLYGRALVFPAGSGLIDTKGTGAQNPSLGADKNGLLDIEEAVMEYSIEKLVNQVFIHSRSGYQTIEHYAVLNYGFLEKSKNKGKWLPAAVLLRQAHIRATENWTCIAAPRALKIENLLRKYGISSVGNVKHINTQGSLANEHDGDAVVDFSSFSFHREFKEPLRDFIPTWTHESILVAPDSPDFVQPDPRLLVRPDFFYEERFALPWLTMFLERDADDGRHFPTAFARGVDSALEKQKKEWEINAL